MGIRVSMDSLCSISIKKHITNGNRTIVFELYESLPVVVLGGFFVSF